MGIAGSIVGSYTPRHAPNKPPSGRGRRTAAVAMAGAMVLAVATSGALAQTGDIVLASTADDGTKGFLDSFRASLSDDGTRVAFTSDDNNLDPADTDFKTDVYVKDLATGDIVLASTADDGTKSNDFSYGGSLSADGTMVAFASQATNLDPGDTDLVLDMYVKDLDTGDIVLASTADDGTKGNGASGDIFEAPILLFASLSADGTTVAFGSSATNLDPGDTDDTRDVYVKDLDSGDIVLASTADDGTKGNGASRFPSLSADGTTVTFDSSATNLDPGDTDDTRDVYVKDPVTGNIVLASTTDDGTKGNGASRFPSLSADGTKVAFHSEATNLDPGDTDSLPDVYVKDLVTGDLVLASTTDDGTKSNGSSFRTSLSADGTTVAFGSSATNLNPADTDDAVDVYVKDLDTGDLVLASTADDGTKGNDSSGFGGASLSGDGTTVAFDSSATNLDPGDTDSLLDVYVKTLTADDEPVIAPTVTADPTSAPVGTTFTITGTGFTPDGTADVTLDGPAGTEAWSIVVGPDGTFTDMIDTDGDPPGNYRYDATDTESGLHAFVTFEVTTESGITPVGEITLVDGLAGADPDDPFEPDEFDGAGGVAVGRGILAGPQFTLDRPTVITEVGAFLFESIFDRTAPFEVQLRPGLDGAPHPDQVLATLPVTWDRDGSTISYEAATRRVKLPAGTYYALFAGTDDNVLGGLLDQVSLDGARVYTPDEVTLGFVFPDDPDRSPSTSVLPAAVQVIGQPLPGD